MKNRPSSSTTEGARSGTTGRFVLGRERFAQISAVEGIRLTADMRSTLDRFEHDRLSAAERRRAIVQRYTPTR